MRVKYVYLLLAILLISFYDLWNSVITSDHLKEKGELEKVYKREKWIVCRIVWNCALCLLIGIVGMYGT